MSLVSWQRRQQISDGARTVGGWTGRAGVAGMARVIGTPRLIAWAVEAAPDPATTVGEVTRELTPLLPVGPADVVGNYLRGYVLLGRGGQEKPEMIFVQGGPRAVIDAASSHVPSRVRTHQRRGDVRLVWDAPVAEVVRRCGERPKTWIMEPMPQLWEDLAGLGLARAVGAYRGTELVAGLWGIEVGRTFGIMSMFHRENAVGAVVLAGVVDAVPQRWDLVDCGAMNPNFARYGAVEISPQDFQRRVLAGLGPGGVGTGGVGPGVVGPG